MPRPEWYFLGLFQLLKYFPGKWEVVGAMVMPGVVAALLALLPWLDRGPARDPRRRPLVIGVFTLGLAAVSALTTLGWMDGQIIRRRGASAGLDAARDRRPRVRPDRRVRDAAMPPDGMSDPLERMPSTRGPEWLAGHIADPEMIAPGLREPPAAVGEREAAAIVAYVRKLSRAARIQAVGAPAPNRPPAIFARYCVGCHVIDGEGGEDGPELSHVGTQARRALI